ncbi:MAG: peptidoglycan DD-metalloendopeptidase family protein [Firmicutes bacterium]|nr:peptidoglycan DD-metalloendopeptidase family protein [Bacillota bacterium]
MRKDLIIPVQKLLLYICLLNLAFIFPGLGNSIPLQGQGLKANTNPASNLSPFPGVPGLLENTGQVAYSVNQGDTLSQISRDYFVSLSAVIASNQIPDPDQISPGQKLLIPPVDYVYALNRRLIERYPVKYGDTIDGICRTFGIAKWQIYRLNPEIKNRNPAPGQGLFVPGKPVTLSKKTTPKSGHALLSGLLRPVRGLISSRFGPRWGRIHYGIDIAAPVGQPVLAAADGQVSYAGWRGTYGRLIIVKHGTYSTYYGHLSKIMVKPGETVTQGQTIGLVGATGRAYGSHLHFEVERSGVKLNPLHYLKR